MNRLILSATITLLIAAASWAASPPQTGTVVQPTPVTSGMTQAEAEALRDALSKIPPGSRVDIQVEHQTGGRQHTHNEGVGIGAGATATGDKLQQGMDGTPPKVGLEGGNTASGGGYSANTSVTAMIPPSDAKGVALLIAGIVVILIGGGLFYFGIHDGALLAWGVGISLIAIAFYPGLALFVTVGLIAVLVIYGGYKAYQALKHKEAARAQAAAAGDLSPDAHAEYQANLASHADTRDVATINAIKAADSIPVPAAGGIQSAVDAVAARLESMVSSFRGQAPATTPPPPVIVVAGQPTAQAAPSPSIRVVEPSKN